MEKSKIRSSIFLLAMLLVVGTGCSQEPNAETPKTTETPVNEAAQSPQTVKKGTGKDTEVFQEGVMIDVSDYKNEQKYKELLQTLESNMNAMVKKDAVAFEKTFLSQKDFESNRFFLDTQDRYQFVGKPTIIEQEDKDRIDVGVRYRVKGSEVGENFKETGIMYNFKKDASGDWKVIMID
ncbi:hypothetical protein GCM10008014_47470 [Paenibacillus silvae]|uniref:Uncharacterized protein n=1 Tax=Paenibacillus silvae TaxID=1325358 RepID=A0ABQ1ZJE1_9BACL|nr:hypothetical protein [Paenibacillus silvae]GGH66744.1 hypothetical protein GCM10008014_47470 [Paenibacillus silvae]